MLFNHFKGVTTLFNHFKGVTMLLRVGERAYYSNCTRHKQRTKLPWETTRQTAFSNTTIRCFHTKINIKLKSGAKMVKRLVFGMATWNVIGRETHRCIGNVGLSGCGYCLVRDLFRRRRCGSIIRIISRQGCLLFSRRTKPPKAQERTTATCSAAS